MRNMSLVEKIDFAKWAVNELIDGFPELYIILRERYDIEKGIK